MKTLPVKHVQPGRRWIGRLPHGVDLLDALTEVCRRRGVRLGRIEAIGAVQRARMSFYDQTKQKYVEHSWAQPMEILLLVGNVSMKDGRPFVHAHLTLADARGRAFGGHLAQGTIVFACEFILEEFRGASLARQPDTETGLSLWSTASPARPRKTE